MFLGKPSSTTQIRSCIWKKDWRKQCGLPSAGKRAEAHTPDCQPTAFTTLLHKWTEPVYAGRLSSSTASQNYFYRTYFWEIHHSKVRLEKTRSTLLMQTGADPQTSSPELPAHSFQAKNVLRNHIVNLGIKKPQTKCTTFLFGIKSILIRSMQAAILILDGLLLDYFETTYCPLCLQKHQLWCLKLHLKDSTATKKINKSDLCSERANSAW